MTSGSSIQLKYKNVPSVWSLVFSWANKEKKKRRFNILSQKRKIKSVISSPPELNLESVTYLARSRGREYILRYRRRMWLHFHVDWLTVRFFSAAPHNQLSSCACKLGVIKRSGISHHCRHLTNGRLEFANSFPLNLRIVVEGWVSVEVIIVSRRCWQIFVVLTQKEARQFVIDFGRV